MVDGKVDDDLVHDGPEELRTCMNLLLTKADSVWEMLAYEFDLRTSVPCE